MIIKKTKNLLIIYIILIATFLGVMISAYAVPNKRINWHVVDSIEQFEAEGVYPKLFFGSHAAQLDNFTDSWMINMAYSADNDNIIKSALENPHTVATGYAEGKYTKVENLKESVQNPENTTIETYSRYWHGYMGVLRPLLLFFSYQEIRFLNMCALFLLFMIVNYLLKKKLGTGIMLGFFFTLMSMMFIIVPMSIQFSSMFYVMFIGMIAVLLNHKNIEKKQLSIYLFFIIGSVASFLDLLTVPLITLGIPLTVYILLKEKQSLVNNTLDIIKTSILWALGYGLTWASKWVIASLILKKNIVQDALNQILVRTGDSTSGGAINISDVFTANTELIFNDLTSKLLIVFFIIWIISMIFYRKDIDIIVQSLPILIIGLMPFVWYIVLKNHSIIHFWFTYRSLGVSMFAILGFMIYCLDFNLIKRKINI